ncbi:type III-A CRISPR-associated RAMP protein Csm5 [Thermovibrio sp.]
MGIEPVSFEVRLKVKTPTAVTTGQEYTLFEALFKGRELWIIDFNALIEKLKREGKLSLFLSLLRNFSDDKFLELHNFYRKEVGREEAKAILYLTEEVLKFLKEKFRKLSKLRRVDLEKYRQELGKGSIKRIFRTPTTQLPYIPGSSLKGAVRTALLNYLIKNGFIEEKALKEKFLQILQKYGIQHWPSSYSKRRIHFKLKELKEELDSFFGSLDALLLCDFLITFDEGDEPPDTSRDLMRFVKVSDLYPVDTPKVGVGRLKRRLKDGSEKPFGFTALEFLEPGTWFKGTITLYPEFIKKYLTCPLEVSPEVLVKALRMEYSKVINWEISFFNKSFSPLVGGDRERYLENKERIAMVKLGFGAGALSKTLSAASELRFLGNQETGVRNEPTTLPVIEGKPLGWCLLEVS